MEWKLLTCDCCTIRGAGLKELPDLKREDAVSLAPSPACAGLSAGSRTTNDRQLLPAEVEECWFGVLVLQHRVPAPSLTPSLH